MLTMSTSKSIHKMVEEARKAKSINDLSEPAANLFNLLVLIVDIQYRRRNHGKSLENNYKEE